MKDEIDGEPNRYSFLIDGISEHKKSKGMNKNVIQTINYCKYKYFLLN